MNMQSIINLALSVIAKKDEIIALIQEAMALWKKIQEVLPGLTKQLEGIISQPSEASQPSDGYSIKWLQESLNKLVGANLKVDGSYGEGTRAAVKKFQESHGLTADGWAGVQTQAAILDALK